MASGESCSVENAPDDAIGFFAVAFALACASVTAADRLEGLAGVPVAIVLVLDYLGVDEPIVKR